jgi:hypothetical protein
VGYPRGYTAFLLFPHLLVIPRCLAESVSFSMLKRWVLIGVSLVLIGFFS